MVLGKGPVGSEAGGTYASRSSSGTARKRERNITLLISCSPAPLGHMRPALQPLASGHKWEQSGSLREFPM